MICYMDKTYCVNKECTKQCNSKLTPEVEEKAKKLNMPISQTDYNCEAIKS